MDHRIFIAAAFGLVLVAIGGFYFALSQRPHQAFAPPAQTSAAPDAVTTAAKATTASIEAEIALSDHAELQALLKRHFNAEYNELIAVAVRRRNEGVSDVDFGQELFGRFQEIMRSKLKHAVGASTPTIDRLAANEVSLFKALGTEGAPFCLKVLGKDETAADAPLPDSVRRMMRLGALYRFQAIVEGMPSVKPVDAMTADEMATFEASLARDGLRFEEVRTGAFLSKEGNELGKPCLMIEKLYRSIARLGEGTRRKLYAGMFFIGRDN